MEEGIVSEGTPRERLEGDAGWMQCGGTPKIPLAGSPNGAAERCGWARLSDLPFRHRGGMLFGITRMLDLGQITTPLDAPNCTLWITAICGGKKCIDHADPSVPIGLPSLKSPREEGPRGACEGARGVVCGEVLPPGAPTVPPLPHTPYVRSKSRPAGLDSPFTARRRVRTDVRLEAMRSSRPGQSGMEVDQ